MIHAQHFPLERLYKRGRFKVEDFRKKVLADFPVSVRSILTFTLLLKRSSKEVADDDISQWPPLG
jgi:hypothetical protein